MPKVNSKIIEYNPLLSSSYIFMYRFSEGEYQPQYQFQPSASMGALNYSKSQGRLTLQNDLNNYPNRIEQYQQAGNDKEKLFLHFSSNSFHKNKMESQNKTKNMLIPKLNIDKIKQDQSVTGISPTLKSHPFQYGQKIQYDFNKVPKTDRNISYVGKSSFENEENRSTMTTNLSRGDLECHLTFKNSPKKKIHQNNNTSPKTARTDHKKSLSDLFQLKVVQPEITRNQKKLNLNQSIPCLHNYSDIVTSNNNILQKRQKLPTKFTGNRASLNLEGQRCYFNRKEEHHLNQNKSKQLHFEDFINFKKLGQGKFGKVLLMIHKYLGFACAVKVMNKQKIKSQNVTEQLCCEIKIQSYLKHSHLVSLYGMFHDEENIYLIMELLTDNTLYKLMKTERVFDEKNTSIWIKQLCIGVEYMHREKVMHRDIKPENIILQRGIAKIADFGWAAYYADQSRTTLCGTLAYLAPQLLIQSEYSQKRDVWAIGLLTYQLLIGSLPFKIKCWKDSQKITNQNITFPQQKYVSKIAKQFLKISLQKDPQMRGSIDDLLSHPFLSINLQQLFKSSGVENDVNKLFNPAKHNSMNIIKAYKKQVKDTAMVGKV